MQNEQTLVMSSLKNGNEKAVLNVGVSNNQIEGRIRLYNFQNALTGILTLGILSDGKVLKSALKAAGPDLFTFSMPNECELKKFTCALINITNGEAIPLLLGAKGGDSPKTLDIKLAEQLYLLDEKDLKIEQVQTALDMAGIDYDDEEKRSINRAINAELDGSDRCADCKYREAFFAGCQKQNIETTAPKFSEEVKIKQENEFYNEIKEQLDVLFSRYPEETFLSEVISNSKWIKVDYDDSGEYYVIGLIYEGDKLKYISYGVPGQFDINPPRELTENADWLPLDPDKPKDLGYWLTYQSAENGEAVHINVS